MDRLDILEKFSNAFGNLENPIDFFMGFADYIELIDSAPEFKSIISDILAQKKPLEDHLATTEKLCLEKITKIHNELHRYVDKKKIQNAAVTEALQYYDDWIKGKIAGTSTLPNALHDQLREIVKQLYHLPEHKQFASHYIAFLNQEKEEIRAYAPIKEYDEYCEVKAEIETKHGLELWGQLEEMSWLYEIIKHGREKHKALVEEYQKTRSPQVAHNILNYRVLLAEWVSIEKGKPRNPPAFFDIKKIRPLMTRLHNHILSHSIFKLPTSEEVVKVLTTTENKEMPASFRPRLISEKGIGYLQIFKQARKHKIGGIKTRKFKLVQCLFSPENTNEASYSPVLQGQERVFEAIKLPKDKRNSKLQTIATAKTEMRSIIEFTIKEVQKIKMLQGHLFFNWEGDKIRMNITVPEGNNNQT